MAKNDKIVERQRAYWSGQLVTVLHKGKRSSTVRTAHGFVKEGVFNKELDFNVPEEDATLRFEQPTG